MNRPTVADARKLAKEFGCEGVIILAFDDDCSTYHASYGSGQQRSTDMDSLLNEFMRQIGDAEVTVWSEGDGDAD